MAAGEELSRLEELLRRPDFVLEPSVKESVRQYIKAGGKPEVILESLSEGYVGYAHMAMLMVKWMEVVDDEPSTSHDEFFYLKEFAKSKFDPDKFISVFSSQSTRSQGLAWLDGLLSDPRGRKLIYELSAAHRNSLLLNFAIQKIMKMGYQDEVAAAGSGLASYFSVFHKLLANKVAALLAVVRRTAGAEAEARGSGSGGYGQSLVAAQAQREVTALVKELRDSCEQSQHTYLHVQHVLYHLGSQPGGEALLAVAQQLEADVAAAGPSLPVWTMQKLYVPPGCPPAQVEACNLIGRVLQAGPDGPVSADVMRLHGLYCSGAAEAAASLAAGGSGSGEGGAAAALSVAPLQHPRLMQALLACIFTPGRPPSPDLLAAAADLLARATCSRPRPRGPTGAEGQEAAAEGEEAAAAAAGESELVAETVPALHWAAGLPFRPHGRFTEEDMLTAPQICRLPVVAHGLLHAVSCQLGSHACYEDTAAVAAAVPSMIRISLLVAEGQPHLIPRVLATWSVALTELHRAGLGELCRLVLDGCVALLRQLAGAAGGPLAAPGVREVVELVEAWSRQGAADPALLRYFLLQVLGVCAPPYSPEFCGALVRLLLPAGVRATNVRNEAAAALLREFATAAEGLALRFIPPLTGREQHLLAELAAVGAAAGGGGGSAAGTLGAGAGPR